MTLKKSLTIAATSLAAAGAVAGATAVAQSKTDTVTGRAEAQRSGASPARVGGGSGPAGFAALRQPIAADVPEKIAAFAANPDVAAVVAPDARKARRVTAPDASEWWTIPGDNALCLYINESGVCATSQQASAGKLFKFEIPAPPAPEIPADGSPPIPVKRTADEARRVTFKGLAPDGIDQVTAMSNGRPMAKTKVTSYGTYEVMASDADSLSLSGRNRATMVVPIG